MAVVERDRVGGALVTTTEDLSGSRRRRLIEARRGGRDRLTNAGVERRITEDESEEEPTMTMTDDPDQLDYSEFLALRTQRGGGKWTQELLGLKAAGRLQPLVPVKLDTPFEGKNATTVKNSIRKAATKLGMERLDVLVMGEAIWVCILSESDVRG